MGDRGKSRTIVQNSTLVLVSMPEGGWWPSAYNCRPHVVDSAAGILSAASEREREYTVPTQTQTQTWVSEDDPRPRRKRDQGVRDDEEEINECLCDGSTNRGAMRFPRPKRNQKGKLIVGLTFSSVIEFRFNYRRW